MAETTTTWILKIDGATDNLGIFKTKEEGIDAALKLLSEKFTNIPNIDEVLKQSYTKACKALIEKFKHFEDLRSLDFLEKICELFNEHEYDVSDAYVHIKEDSFLVEMSRGETAIFSFTFGKELDDFHIETNIMDEDAEDGYFLFARNNNESIKYSLHKKESLSSIANCFLVYDALTTSPQLRRELKEKIIHKYNSSPWGYEINLSEDTISNHIGTLKKLGFPIYDRRLNNNDRENQNDLIYFYGNRYKEGFYLDYDRPLTPDYPSLKSGSYIMLVYLTLKEIDRAHALPTQQAIVDAVYNKFGITLKRQNVKIYLDLLKKLDSGIQYDKSGYWMKR